MSRTRAANGPASAPPQESERSERAAAHARAGPGGTRGAKPPANGEDGSATVELSILLPVYMILFVALLTIGHMVLIKQELILAVRYQAWLPEDSHAKDPNSINASFFPDFVNYGGGYTQRAANAQQITLSSFFSNELKQLGGASQDSMTLAKAVLDNAPQGGNQARFIRSGVEGQCTYNPDWLGPFLAQTVHQPSASCVVFVKKKGVPERKIMVVPQGGNGGGNNNDPSILTDKDPIEEFQYSQTPFPISNMAQNYAFYPPNAPVQAQDNGTTVTPAIADSAPSDDPSNDPGIWSTKYRIGGSSDQELDLFHNWIFGGL